jgi:hypothetical protein
MRILLLGMAMTMVIGLTQSGGCCYTLCHDVCAPAPCDGGSSGSSSGASGGSSGGASGGSSSGASGGSSTGGDDGSSG